MARRTTRAPWRRLSAGTDGFGIGFEDADAASGLRVSPLRNAVSRKTFLPTVLHFAEQHQQAASGGC